MTVKKGSKLDIQLKRSIKCEESLFETMDDKQKELFEKLKEKQLQMHSLYECKAFSNGVIFGARLMIEIMSEKVEGEE